MIIRTGKASFLDIIVPERKVHHRFSPQLLLLLLLPPFALCNSSVAESIPTYEHQDSSTGKTLLCTNCPPGTHMAAHCTPSTPTKCVPCGQNHFTELWNYLPRCLYCNNFCEENQEVEKECSATNNRVCRCKDGFYWSDGFCFSHSACKPGLGVKINGMPVCVKINRHLMLSISIFTSDAHPRCTIMFIFLCTFQDCRLSEDRKVCNNNNNNKFKKKFLQERQKRTRCVKIVSMVIFPIRLLRRNRAEKARNAHRNKLCSSADQSTMTRCAAPVRTWPVEVSSLK